jgi:hypothetical protein
MGRARALADLPRVPTRGRLADPWNSAPPHSDALWVAAAHNSNIFRRDSRTEFSATVGTDYDPFKAEAPSRVRRAFIQLASAELDTIVWHGNQ